MKTIENHVAPAAVGPYSQGIEHNDIIYFSGMLPIDPVSGNLIGQNATEQTEQILKNIKALIESEGLQLTDVLKTLIFITSMEDFNKVNEVYAAYFTSHKPARSCVQVAALPKNAMVEIEVIVARK